MDQRRSWHRLVVASSLSILLLIGVALIASSYSMRYELRGWVLASAGVAMLTAGVLSLIEKMVFFPHYLSKLIEDALVSTLPYMGAGITGYMSKGDMLRSIENALTSSRICFLASGIALKSIEGLLQKDSFWSVLKSKSSAFRVGFVLLSPETSTAFASVSSEIKKRNGGDLVHECEGMTDLIRAKIKRHGLSPAILRSYREEIPWAFIVKIDDTIFYNPHLSTVSSPESPVLELRASEGFGRLISREIENYIALRRK